MLTDDTGMCRFIWILSAMPEQGGAELTINCHSDPDTSGEESPFPLSPPRSFGRPDPKKKDRDSLRMTFFLICNNLPRQAGRVFIIRN